MMNLHRKAARERESVWQTHAQRDTVHTVVEGEKHGEPEIAGVEQIVHVKEVEMGSVPTVSVSVLR